MHTEEQAKELYCCTKVSTRCEASKCAAWRWVNMNCMADPCYLQKGHHSYGKNISQDTLGYCGLAGKPMQNGG